jgi:Rhamnan synthesis protein F
LVAGSKIKRELLRIWFKIADLAINPLESITQASHDRRFDQVTKLRNGELSPRSKFAIFFTHQPNGFAKSIALTCKYLSQQGYAVLLVSNAKISEQDQAKIAEYCWKSLERPNYGYDFGGYRDGLRVLKEADINPDRLIIMNDSIWFPISDDTEMIKWFETSDLDFNAPVFENKPGRNKKHQHFQSYFMLLNKRAIQSDGFWNFWKTYKISSKKRIVLLRGEKGFSQAMFRLGFGGNAPSTRTILLGLLHKQSREFLRKTLLYAAYDSETNAKLGRKLLQSYSDTNAWRDDALFHMKLALDTTQPMGAFCYACIKLLNFGFMKKSSYPIVHDGMRWQYLRAVRNGDLPAPHPDILAEIENSKMDGSLTTDPAMSAPPAVLATHDPAAAS